MRLALALLLFGPILPAQTPVHTLLSVIADQRDSMLERQRIERREQGACVIRGVVVPSKAGTLIIPLKLAPGQIDSTTSGAVWWRNAVCGDSLPSVHTHSTTLGYYPQPSLQDTLIAERRRKRVPYHVVFADDGETFVLVVGVTP